VIVMKTNAVASTLFDPPAVRPRRLMARSDRRVSVPEIRADQQASGTIRVAIAHSQRLVRARLHVLLEREPGIAVVGEAADGDQAVALTDRVRPDVVLMDVNLRGLDCVEATRRMLAGHSVAVMVLTASETDARLIATLRAGATGHLPDHWEPAALVRAVRLLGPGGNMSSRRSTRRHSPTKVHYLTPKVIEIRRGRGHEAPAALASPLPLASPLRLVQ
jgi:DNA-binding NarL/FixJ family response regulator